MRNVTNLFLIDGQPMLAPDENMRISVADVEASDSGRDESGFFHRFAVRQGVGSWDFTYGSLTTEEYAYMERLFEGKETFRFTYPDCAGGGAPKEITAYRREHGILWQSAKTGLFRNYQFAVVAC